MESLNADLDAQLEKKRKLEAEKAVLLDTANRLNLQVYSTRDALKKTTEAGKAEKQQRADVERVRL